MNRKNLLLINSLLLIITGFFISCKKDFKIALENAIRRYISGDKTAFADIEENFINTVSVLTIQMEKKIVLSKIALIRDKNSYEIIYPQSFKIRKENLNIRIADYNDDIVALSDGLRIYVADGEGEIVKTVKPGIEASRIKDIVIIGNKIIYYFDEKLYYYNYRSDENGIHCNKKLSPPYAKYYKASLGRIDDNNISVVTGAGGLYYLYIYNSALGEIWNKKYKVSTPKLLCLDNSIYMVKGNAGNWKLVKLDLFNKSEKVIDSFSNISDIELIPEGYLYHIGETLWYKNFMGNKFKIPFKYSINGIINNHAVLKFHNRLFVINWKKMQRKLRHFMAVMPEIFTDNKEISPRNN